MIMNHTAVAFPSLVNIYTLYEYLYNILKKTDS